MINSDGEEDAYLDDPEIVAILPRSSTNDQAISKLKEECFEILELQKTLSEEQSFIAEESCLGQKNSGKKQRWTSHNVPGISTPCESSLMDIPKIQMKLGKQKVLAQGECGNSFHVKGKLPVYRKVHVVESTYMCANCGISFSSNEHLTKIPHVHGAGELYSCPNCGANLFQKPLSSGDQIASLGLNPYSCTECDKSFQNDDDLTKHLASHFENTFWCTECEISFGSEYDLQAHCNSHLEGRLFECIKCGNSFGNSFELLLHQQIHTKKVKKSKKPLSKCKQSVNSEQKQYQCTICKKCFSYQSELKIHVTFHEGKTPIRVRSAKSHSLKVQT
ncbi:zinc finger protein OZF-like isoform X2 [Ambystoma mexicanum]